MGRRESATHAEHLASPDGKLSQRTQIRRYSRR